MDIFPEQLVKAIITGDIDRMEALGIYEVAPEDFALCEFVDSSKLEGSASSVKAWICFARRWLN